MAFTDQLLSWPNEFNMIEYFKALTDGWHMAFTDQLLSGPNVVNMIEYFKATDWWLIHGLYWSIVILA